MATFKTITLTQTIFRAFTRIMFRGPRTKTGLAFSFAVCATIFSATFPSSSQAQERKPTALSLFAKVKIGEKYAVADLAVMKFSGAYDGRNYHVGGTVQNVGRGAYTRTRSVTGVIQGRQIQLFAVASSLYKGHRRPRYKLLRTVAIPPLKAKETWATPVLTISPRDVPGLGNAVFLLMITPGDVDRGNDSKRTTVSFVR